MDGIDRLLELPGAMASFEYSDRGELISHRIAEGAQIDEAALDMLCHVCVANMSIATMQARGWERLTGAEGFYPIDGFSLVGLQWSAVASGGRGVVLANEQADYQAAFDALAG